MRSPILKTKGGTSILSFRFSMVYMPTLDNQLTLLSNPWLPPGEAFLVSWDHLEFSIYFWFAEVRSSQMTVCVLGICCSLSVWRCARKLNCRARLLRVSFCFNELRFLSSCLGCLTWTVFYLSIAAALDIFDGNSCSNGHCGLKLPWWVVCISNRACMAIPPPVKEFKEPCFLSKRHNENGGKYQRMSN